MQSLREQVYHSNDMWIVLVLDDNGGAAAQRYTETLEKAERLSGGLLRGGLLRASGTVAGAGDDDEVPVHSLFNITHVPSLLLWTSGSGSRSDLSALMIPPQLADHLLTQGAKALFEGIAPFLPSVVTAPLRSAGLPSFYSALDPECCPGRLSPVVLLHQNARPSPTLKRLALEFIGQGSFAVVPGNDADILAAFGVDNASLPVLLVGPRGAGLPASADEKKAKKGAPSSSSSSSYVPPVNAFKDQQWKAFPKDKNMSLAALRQWLNATLPPAVVRQLKSQADFERAQKASGVMLIALLGPGDVQEKKAKGGGGGGGAAAGGGALSILSRVSGSYEFVLPEFDSLSSASGFTASRPHMSFSWIDGSAQEDWAEAFGAAAPALIAFNPRKQLYAVMKESFSEENVKEFVRSIPGLIPLHPKAQALGIRPSRDVRLEKMERTLPALKQQVSQADLAAALGGGAKKKKSSGEGEL